MIEFKFVNVFTVLERKYYFKITISIDNHI